jgi:IS1 family transposase
LRAKASVGDNLRAKLSSLSASRLLALTARFLPVFVKTFSHSDLTEQRRYSPPDVMHVKRTPVKGNPNRALISTGYVEKQNHTLRMHCRRLTRLTNAFSKKLENFKAAVALHYAYYNLVKSNIAIGCTPAMAAGVTNTSGHSAISWRW